MLHRLTVGRTVLQSLWVFPKFCRVCLSALSAPILGPELPEHVDELVGAVGWTLPPEAKASLDSVSAGGGPFQIIGSSWRETRQRRPRLG